MAAALMTEQQALRVKEQAINTTRLKIERILNHRDEWGSIANVKSHMDKIKAAHNVDYPDGCESDPCPYTLWKDQPEDDVVEEVKE
tara:strand:+ start:1134 stop:1391 length:258 start_codon:yes stop_codon:yes gene_type:complete